MFLPKTVELQSEAQTADFWLRAIVAIATPILKVGGARNFQQV